MSQQFTNDEPFQVRDKRANNRYFIDNDFLRGGWGKVVGPYAIAVYNAIALHADIETQTAYPSHQKIADLTGMSERQVPRELEKLIQYRIIHVESRAAERKPGLITLLDIDEWLPPGHMTHSHMSPRHMTGSQLTYDRESSQHMTGSHTNNTHDNNTHGTKPNHGNDDHHSRVSLTATPERRLLRDKFHGSVLGPGKRPPAKFPTADVAARFDRAAARLNSNLGAAIDAALGQGINTIVRIVNYVEKYEVKNARPESHELDERSQGIAAALLANSRDADR